MTVRERARDHATLDELENVPFASVGGLTQRTNMKVDPLLNIADADAKAYIAAYCERAEEMYGPDWQTCEFGWKHALTLKGEE